MNIVFNKDLGLYQVHQSGLASVTPPGPSRTNSSDWIAWHFTRIEFLPQIVSAGGLLCDRRAGQSTVIGNAGIKERRLATPIQLPNHPPGTVGDHVPFYFAPRSPTSYAVLRSTCRATDLVFLGVHVGAIAQRLPWCATDGNAVEALSSYTQNVEEIGSHVDLDVLCAQYWRDRTGEDGDRVRRRHAELLVHSVVPLELITHVVCYTPDRLEAVKAILEPVGTARNYSVDTNMFMT